VVAHRVKSAFYENSATRFSLLNRDSQHLDCWHIRSRAAANKANKPTESGKVKNEATGANDFDFLIGNWRVHHCRLKERLADNHEWI
jgi:hypothetical protein